MKLLNWIPLFCSMLLYGQGDLAIVRVHDFSGLDTLWYENHQNSFSYNDENLLVGYDLLNNSPQTNFGVPIIGKPTSQRTYV